MAVLHPRGRTDKFCEVGAVVEVVVFVDAATLLASLAVVAEFGDKHHWS